VHRSLFVGAGLLLAAAAAAAPAPDLTPEQELIAAMDNLQTGRVDDAWIELDHLVKRQPNFRLAQLFYRQLQEARSEEPARVHPVANDPELRDLMEEARLRLENSRQPIPANSVPDAILQLAPEHSSAILVDMSRARLYLLENRDGALTVTRSLYASSGKNGAGKQAFGDQRTPIGVYRITAFTPGRQLPDLYGSGAFPLSYPNVWDRRLGNRGAGIWLHGVPSDTYARPPRSTDGCVALSNDDLLGLKSLVAPGETPVVLSDHLTWRPRGSAAPERDEVMAQIEAWRARWSALDTEGYLKFYADDFETEGMGKRTFAQHKYRVNAGKSRIDVRLAAVDLFRYPGDEPLVVAHFTQHYTSSNYTKVNDKEQFWRRGANGQWRIVKEASR
jgi:murein L,D-transpeptidase YafK